MRNRFGRNGRRDSIARMKRRGRRVAMGAGAVGVVVLLAAGVALKDRLIEAWLTYRFQSEDPGTRENAARSLAARGSLVCLDYVVEQPWRSDEGELIQEEEVEPWIREYWRRVGDRAIPRLLEAWDAGDEDRQRFVTMAVRLIGSPAESAVPHLLGRLRDTDKETRIAAIETLGLMREGGMGGTIAAQGLAAALEDPEQLVRHTAAGCLVYFEAESDVFLDAVIQRFKDRQENAGVRVTCLAVASEMTPRDIGVTLYVEALGDPSRTLRLLAAHSALRDERFRSDVATAAVSGLVGCLGDPDTNARVLAVGYLGDLGAAARSAVPPLKYLAESDPAPWVRRDAAEALKKVEGATDASPR